MNSDEKEFWQAVLRQEPDGLVEGRDAEILGGSFNGAIAKALNYVAKRFLAEGELEQRVEEIGSE